MQKARQGGHTLVEWLLVMALGAVLLAIGVPAMRGFVAGRAVQASVGEFAASLRLARAEAIRRGARVSLCRSTDGRQCAANATGRDWASGWLVFVDHGVRGQVEPGDTVLAVQSPATGGQILAAGTATYVISYLPSGMAPGAQNNLKFLPALPPDAAAPLQRIACISATGGLRVVPGAVC